MVQKTSPEKFTRVEKEVEEKPKWMQDEENNQDDSIGKQSPEADAKENSLIIDEERLKEFNQLMAFIDQYTDAKAFFD